MIPSLDLQRVFVQCRHTCTPSFLYEIAQCFEPPVVSLYRIDFALQNTHKSENVDWPRSSDGFTFCSVDCGKRKYILSNKIYQIR